MVQPIREKYPDKLKLYATKADLKIYIHSKIMIIDDVFLTIGSANWNRRSDLELNADVVDTETVTSPEGVTVGKIPRDFRIRKFHEMTGLSYEKLDAMTFLDQLSIMQPMNRPSWTTWRSSTTRTSSPSRTPSER